MRKNIESKIVYLITKSRHAQSAVATSRKNKLLALVRQKSIFAILVIMRAKLRRRKMKELDNERLIHIIQRLSLILGYASGFISDYAKTLPEIDKDKYYWLINAIENVLYLDKPLPPMP
jgi:hypothetical protein